MTTCARVWHGKEIWLAWDHAHISTVHFSSIGYKGGHNCDSNHPANQSCSTKRRTTHTQQQRIPGQMTMQPYKWSRTQLYTMSFGSSTSCIRITNPEAASNLGFGCTSLDPEHSYQDGLALAQQCKGHASKCAAYTPQSARSFYIYTCSSYCICPSIDRMWLTNWGSELHARCLL